MNVKRLYFFLSGLLGQNKIKIGPWLPTWGSSAYHQWHRSLTSSLLLTPVPSVPSAHLLPVPSVYLIIIKGEPDEPSNLKYDSPIIRCESRRLTTHPFHIFSALMQPRIQSCCPVQWHHGLRDQHGIFVVIEEIGVWRMQDCQRARCCSLGLNWSLDMLHRGVGCKWLCTLKWLMALTQYGCCW